MGKAQLNLGRNGKVARSHFVIMISELHLDTKSVVFFFFFKVVRGKNNSIRRPNAAGSDSSPAFVSLPVKFYPT